MSPASFAFLFVMYFPLVHHRSRSYFRRAREKMKRTAQLSVERSIAFILPSLFVVPSFTFSFPAFYFSAFNFSLARRSLFKLLSKLFFLLRGEAARAAPWRHGEMKAKCVHKDEAKFKRANWHPIQNRFPRQSTYLQRRFAEIMKIYTLESCRVCFAPLPALRHTKFQLR